MNPLFLADFYKVGHASQYPTGTQQVWSNWTPRYNHDKTKDGIVHFGLQYLIKRYLDEEFRDGFFSRKCHEVLAEYREFVKATLGIEHPRVDHIMALWQRQYLPIEIYSLPEGSIVSPGVPPLVITNTNPAFYWLPNYLETLLSACLWKPSTSATTALKYRKLFRSYAEKAGETDFSFIEWQGHDFSMRGMSGVEDAILSGMGHLTCFSGTDSMPAIIAAARYYGAALTCGGSVPATEHSVMQAAGNENEFETFKRLITEIYPSGVLSIVSDTWDLWRVLTDYMPKLRETILNRQGKIVIRPDSGDPVKIICGDSDATSHCAVEGVATLLARHFPVKSGPGGCADLQHVGMIYGDSITPQRADDILRLLMIKGFGPYNIVFGIGSYTYEYVTRDTHGFAMKATAVRNSAGEVIPIYKKPVTDNGGKTSLKGIPIVVSGKDGFSVSESTEPSDLDNCAYRKVYRNGKTLITENFDEIRKRVRGE